MYDITLNVWIFLWIIFTAWLVGAVSIIFIIAKLTHRDDAP